MTELSKEMSYWFIKRTKEHIAKVQKYCRKIEAYDLERFKKLVNQSKGHDQSKYKTPEIIPYIWLTWRYKCEQDGTDFEYPKGVEEQVYEATLHHVKNNSHHPEFHTNQEDDIINQENRDEPPKELIDATKMPLLDVAEMVADWLAMSEELGTNPKEWADNNVNIRWKFTPEQKDLIYELIKNIKVDGLKKVAQMFEEKKVSDQSVLSRFEEGKPADPTENMSEEDAKKWWEMHEKNKANFKSASYMASGNLKRLVQYNLVMGNLWRDLDRLMNQLADQLQTPIDDNNYKRVTRLISTTHDNLAKFASAISAVKEDCDFLKKRIEDNAPWFVKSAAVTIRTADQDKSAPAKVDKYFKKVKENNPDYTDAQAWATAWSIYCKHVKPDSPSCHQTEYLKGKSANEEVLSRFEEGVPADPTENMSEEDAETWKEMNEEYKDQFKTAFTKTGGFSYKTDRMSVLFVEGRKIRPFNIDVIKDINNIYLPILADDGEMHEAPLSVNNHQSSGLVTRIQEDRGMRRETKVDITFPVDEEGSPATSERTAFSAVADLGKKLGFKVEPVHPGYKPQARNIK